MTMNGNSLTIGKAINSGESFTLPLDAATQKLALLARSGAGKSYLATLLAELLYGAGIQIVALDPVGIWYGLRLAADGKSPGLSIPVFGGEYGDIPLEPGAGALVADVIVDRNISVILDVSGFRKNQRKEFVTAFAEQLFHRKKTARSPMMLFLEESQFFIPQKTFKGEERMLGAFEDIGKVGRNYGIGLTLISQRPQAVNKDVLNQTEALFALQTNGAQERKAIQAWISEKGLEGEAINELPKLEIGQAYVWSPQWLKFFGKVQIGQKRTYNASATPTFNTKSTSPKPLAQTDLQALLEAMQQVVKQAEAKDPRVLQRRILELERQLKNAPSQPRKETIVERVEVPVLQNGQVKHLEQAITSMAEVGAQLSQIAQELKAVLVKIGSAPPITSVSHELRAPEGATPLGIQIKPETKPAPILSAPKQASTPPMEGVTAPQQRILDALAAFDILGLRSVARHNVAVWSSQSPTSGGYTNNLGRLRSMGLIDYPASGEVALTEAGQSIARPITPIATIEELHEAWYTRLPKPQARILRALVSLYPEAMERIELAEAAGQSPTSGGYTNNLGALRSLGLIDYPRPGWAAATGLLFPRI